MLKFRYSKKGIIQTIVLLSAIVLAFLFIHKLFYDAPQSSKYVYLFQCYWYPGGEKSLISEEERILNPPAGFTGVWRRWERSGRLLSESNYLDGKLHGVATRYSSGYKGRYSDLYKNGKYLRRIEYLDRFGNVKMKLGHKKFLPHGKWQFFDEYGKLTSERSYVKGILQDENPEIYDVPPSGFTGDWITYYPNSESKMSEYYYFSDTEKVILREWYKSEVRLSEFVNNSEGKYCSRIWFNYNGYKEQLLYLLTDKMILVDLGWDKDGKSVFICLRKLSGNEIKEVYIPDKTKINKILNILPAEIAEFLDYQPENKSDKIDIEGIFKKSKVLNDIDYIQESITFIEIIHDMGNFKLAEEYADILIARIKKANTDKN
ncbi:MAG: toxin-antitoxin system YwqK family antitoxin, partial [Planctomycetota bacterium]